MGNFAYDPYSSEEMESRFQELRAQQVRASELFHQSSVYLDADDMDDDMDDPYLADYDDGQADGA